MELSDRVLRGLLEAAPDAIVAVDERGVIVFANHQTEELLGWPPAQLLGLAVETLVPERFVHHHPLLRAGYERSPATRPMGATTELWARRLDGVEIPVEISLSAIATDDGQLVAAAIRDVTQARLAEQKFRGLLASAPDAIIGVDADGRIELLNEQAERLFGWSAAELIGRPIEVLVPPDALESHVVHRASYLTDPVSRPMGLGLQLSGRRRDGSEFPAEISLSTIGAADRRSTVLAAVRDASDRLELERVRQRQALEAQREQSHRLESLGQLAGGVAHDFNNLLGVILNYATLAQRGVDDPLVSDDIAQICNAAERAADLTRQLLSFARRDLVRPEDLVVGELIGAFAQLLHRTLGEQIELIVDVGQEPLALTADRHQVEQVLLNLCLNARDAMPDGGTIRVSAHGLQVDGSATPDLAPGRYVVIRVADEGTGMNPEVLDRAFEPFFTTKGPGDGTGLGLATVYGIVQQNQGDVRIRSKPDRGTTVEVFLPAAKAAPSAHPEPTPAGSGGSEHVLVVEDEESLRTIVVRMLRGHGYRVSAASNGVEALAMLDASASSDPVCLVLTDVVMPEMSGPELVAKVRATEPTGLRVLFMSGYAPTHRDLEGETLLQKPFTEGELFEAVRGALDGR